MSQEVLEEEGEGERGQGTFWGGGGGVGGVKSGQLFSTFMELNYQNNLYFKKLFVLFYLNSLFIVTFSFRFNSVSNPIKHVWNIFKFRL